MRPNPTPDEGLRALERAAASGDLAARRQLLIERRRRGVVDPLWRGARRLYGMALRVPDRTSRHPFANASELSYRAVFRAVQQSRPEQRFGIVLVDPSVRHGVWAARHPRDPGDHAIHTVPTFVTLAGFNYDPVTEDGSLYRQLGIVCPSCGSTDTLTEAWFERKVPLQGDRFGRGAHEGVPMTVDEVLSGSCDLRLGSGACDACGAC